MKSKLISISALSAAFIAVFLLVGSFFEIADVFTVVISSVFVILPLYFNSYKGSFLAFLAGGVVAFMCSGFNLISLVFPAYFAFFGIYPIVKCIMIDKKFNKYVGFILGLLWCVAVFFGLYYYYTLFMGFGVGELPEWAINYVEVIVAVVAVIFFIVFDRFIVVVRRVVDFYLKKIIK